MKWWQRALLVSVLWLAFVAGGGWYLTTIVLRGKLNAKQDETISEAIGMACGLGLGIIWLASAVFRKKPAETDRES